MSANPITTQIAFISVPQDRSPRNLISYFLLEIPTAKTILVHSTVTAVDIYVHITLFGA